MNIQRFIFFLLLFIHANCVVGDSGLCV